MLTQPGMEKQSSPVFPRIHPDSCLCLKKKKKIHVLSILILFLIIPTNTWMAFNNLLAFQLLNMSQVSRGTRCRRSPRGKPGQLT